MKCLEFRTAVTLPSEGERGETLAAKLQQHMEQCPECRNYARQMGAVVRLLSRLPEREAPDGFTGSVCEALSETAPRGGWRAWFQRLFGYLRAPAPLMHPALTLATTAAICLALVGMVLALRSGPPAPPVAGEMLNTEVLSELIEQHEGFVSDQPLGDDSGFRLVSHDELDE